MPHVHASLRSLAPVATALLLAACSPTEEASPTLAEARAGFKTKLVVRYTYGEAPATPPTGALGLIHYPGTLGAMAAYVSPDPEDGRRHPAVIWLAGGFSNSIGSLAWMPGPPENDQSAAGFRRHGIVMMYPALRGGNTNPGNVEACFGEVDDVLAAAAHLATLAYVDPARIYLGGHSTGGTLALLVAETGTTRFRAIFSLGPLADVTGYGSDVLPFDVSHEQEARLRAPIHWLGAVRCPTYVFEGTTRSNITSLRKLEKACRNPRVRFHDIPGGDHFDIIAPLVARMAEQIQADRGDVADLEFKGLAGLVRRRQTPGGG
jgi:alpha-beta hydrolase superfamily lysophospholipase